MAFQERAIPDTILLRRMGNEGYRLPRQPKERALKVLVAIAQLKLNRTISSCER